MPFGNSCEFMDFDACVAKHKEMGKSEEEARSMCGMLQRDTEEKCREQHAAGTHASLLGEVDPRSLLTCSGEVGLEITASAPIGWGEIKAQESEQKIPTFEMLAYTGSRMRLEGFHHEVVVDLSGVKVSGKTIPIYRQHDPLMIVGHGTAEVSGADIRIKGLVSADNEHARDVVSSAKRGFPWQSSIGAGIVKIEFVKPGEKSSVNGRVETGPLLIARQTLLSETSFVPRGADRKTSAKVAAKALTLSQLHHRRQPGEKSVTLAELRCRNLLAEMNSTMNVGDRVTVKPGKEHDEMTKGKTGTIKQIGTTALGVMFDGMNEIHKWYVEDELTLAELQTRRKS